MFKNFKKWAYSRPTYESENWNKLDKALSLDTDKVNTGLNKFGQKIDGWIAKINPEIKN